MVGYTFHALGQSILARSEPVKPSLAPWAQEDREGNIVSQLVQDLFADSAFKQKFMVFVALWSHRFEEELEWLWKKPDPEEPTKLDAYNLRLREARQEAEKDDPKRLPTMQGETVRSEQELAIANWLFIHGVKYAYEKPFEVSTATSDKRQYLPDFYYPDVQCWHEHYALNRHGQPPDKFGTKYLEGVAWKRKLHTEHKTRYFETSSAQFQDGTVFERLHASLASYGIEPKLLAWEQIEERMVGELAGHYSLLKTAIKHFKSNALSMADVRERARKHSMPVRALSFVEILEPIYQAYERKLKELNCIDFEDMIRRSTEAIRSGRYRHPYRLILVDEFQDISTGRAALVRAMLDQNPDAQLFAVGDDWQSIYRFAGSDISVMTRFESNFGVTAHSSAIQAQHPEGLVFCHLAPPLS